MERELHIILTDDDPDGRPSLERALQHQSLEEAESHYHTLFDSVPLGLYRATPGGHITDANLTLARMVGYPDRESLLSSHALDKYISSEDLESMQTLLESQGIVRNFQTRMQLPDGTEQWLELNAQAIRDANGNVLYYDGTVEDITARKRAEEALQRRNRDLALFNQIGQMFTTTLDLRQVSLVVGRAA
jgi:PAS domain S-box-containing protein